MDKKLLSILCCPVTHNDLALAKPEVVARLNAAIAAGEALNRDGEVLSEKLTEALITADGKTIYPVVDGIPVLLEGESIAGNAFAAA